MLVSDMGCMPRALKMCPRRRPRLAVVDICERRPDDKAVQVSESEAVPIWIAEHTDNGVTYRCLGSAGRGKHRTVSAAAKRQPMTATASTVKGKRAGTARPGSSTAVSTR